MKRAIVRAQVGMVFGADLFVDEIARGCAIVVARGRLEKWLESQGYQPFGDPIIRFVPPDPDLDAIGVRARLIVPAVHIVGISREVVQ